MLKPSVERILLFLLLKQFFYYLYYMWSLNYFILTTPRFRDIAWTIPGFILFWAIHYITSLILFSIPLYFSFKIKNFTILTVCVSSILILEFIIYINLSNQKIVDVNLWHYFMINMLLLISFFYKTFKVGLSHRAGPVLPTNYNT